MKDIDKNYKILRTSKKYLVMFFILSSLPVSFIFCILFLIDFREDTFAFAVVYHVTIALILAETIRRYFNYKYVFTSTKVIDIEGIASAHLTQNIVDYIDIREIKINQSLLGRMIGYADLLISTASTSGIEITIKNIDEANELNKFINDKKAEIMANSKQS